MPITFFQTNYSLLLTSFSMLLISGFHAFLQSFDVVGPPSTYGIMPMSLANFMPRYLANFFMANLSMPLISSSATFSGSPSITDVVGPPSTSGIIFLPSANFLSHLF